ncbi:leucine-rich repeat-containing protein 14B isoform X2 [Panthera pardus]|uniref:Leucine-rich repeat-containing protein 14B isoform X2 n=1 Tax=Panthera pardus TaxID=9691 RepID=A0A9V1F280_PANPR|nr:leucine-rich repeat-containing protein 14B isoform X2 [Panthera pardus]
MRSLRFISAEALVSHPQVAKQSLDGVAHNLYPLLFKASYLLEQAEVIRTLLERWPLEEFWLSALLGPRSEPPEDLRDRACRACLEACVQGLADHVLRAGGPRRLRVADLTGIRDVQVQQCPCGRALGRWGRTELLARTCCRLQAEPLVAQRPIQVFADLFVTEGNFKVVVQALGPSGPAPLRVRCLSFRADSLGPSQLLHVLRLAGPGELRRLEVVHNVRLHAGHVQQLLAQVGFPQLASLTLPAKAFDAPPTSTPTPDGEDPLLTSIAWELSQMTQLTELSVAFSTLTGKIRKLLGLLGRAAQTLRILTLEECSIEDSHMSMLILALSPCHELCELRFLGNPLSARALRRLFTALCELPKLRCVEFPVPKDCYPEGTAYPQDELAMSKFDQQKYNVIAEDLRAVLLRAGRGDIQVCTPLFGSFDPDIQETSNELGAFLLQAFKTALENFSRALEQM